MYNSTTHEDKELFRKIKKENFYKRFLELDDNIFLLLKHIEKMDPLNIIKYLEENILIIQKIEKHFKDEINTTYRYVEDENKKKELNNNLFLFDKHLESLSNIGSELKDYEQNLLTIYEKDSRFQRIKENFEKRKNSIIFSSTSLFNMIAKIDETTETNLNWKIEEYQNKIEEFIKKEYISKEKESTSNNLYRR
jgi:hypothetical protein